MGFFDLAGFLWTRDVRGGAGLVRDCGSYLVRISLPLLVRRRRYSSPSCSKTASRPPPIRSLTAIRLTGGLEEIGLWTGFPGMLLPTCERVSNTHSQYLQVICNFILKTEPLAQRIQHIQ